MGLNRQYTFSIPLFDGGLNTNRPATSLELHQSPSLNAIEYDNYGAVQSQKGYAFVNTAPVKASALVCGIHSYVKNTGTSFLMAAVPDSSNGDIWRLSGTSFTQISGSTNLYTAGVNVNFLTSNDVVVAVNGYVRPYKWNGSDSYMNFGVSAPTGVASAVSTAAGVLLGTYTWAMTGVNSANMESDYTVVTSALTVTSGRVTITGLPVYPASAGVITKYLYRNTAGVATSYWRVTALSAAQTTVIDNNADGSGSGYAGLVTAASTDNGVMPPCKYVIEYKGYLFAAGNPSDPMKLYYSKTGQPECWPVANAYAIGDGDGLPITGLAALGNSVIIQKGDAQRNGCIYLLYITDSAGASSPSNWYLMRSPSQYGGCAHRAQAFFGNVLGFLNRYGWFALDASGLAPTSAQSNVGSFQVDSHSFDIDPDIADFPLTYINGACAITYKNKVWLAVPKGSTATANNTLYTYDFVRASNSDRKSGAWGKFAGVGMSCFTVHGGELYGASSALDGTVYKMNTGNNISTTVVTTGVPSYYYTPEMAGLKEHKDNTKVFRWVYLTLAASGGWNMVLSYILDGHDDLGTTEFIDLTPNGHTWGAGMVWGVDEWASTQTVKLVRVMLRNAVGKTLKLRFSTPGGMDQYFKVQEIKVGYNLRGIR